MIKVCLEAANLLMKMLEFDPKKRLSSISALCHPVFNSQMSKSPLVVKKIFNSEQLIRVTSLMEEFFY